MLLTSPPNIFGGSPQILKQIDSEAKFFLENFFKNLCNKPQVERVWSKASQPECQSVLTLHS